MFYKKAGAGVSISASHDTLIYYKDTTWLFGLIKHNHLNIDIGYDEVHTVDITKLKKNFHYKCFIRSQEQAFQFQPLVALTLECMGGLFGLI